jgi:CheY-like chemotaxis protein
MSASRRKQESRLSSAKSGSVAQVLVVEDNRPLRELMADVLALEGCTVTEAFDATSMQWWLQMMGQERYPDEPFDLIITDVHIPGETGLVALERLRRKGCHIPAIVVTAFPEEVTQQRVDHLEAVLVSKPFRLDEFRTAAAVALQSNSRRADIP